MKALITAFALLSFVAASTIPMVTKAQAQTQTEQTMPKKKAKKGKTPKKTAKKKTNPQKMKKPNQA